MNRASRNDVATLAGRIAHGDEERFAGIQCGIGVLIEEHDGDAVLVLRDVLHDDIGRIRFGERRPRQGHHSLPRCGEPDLEVRRIVRPAQRQRSLLRTRN